MKNKRKVNQLDFENERQNKKDMKLEYPNALMKLQDVSSSQSLPRILKPYLQLQQIKNRALRSDKQLQKVKNKLKGSSLTSREMMNNKNVIISSNIYDVNLGRQSKMVLKRENRENRMKSMGKENLGGKFVKKCKDGGDFENIKSELSEMKSFFNVIHNKLKNAENRPRGDRKTFDELDLEIGQSKQNSKNYSELLKECWIFDKDQQFRDERIIRKKMGGRERDEKQKFDEIGGSIQKLQRLHEDNESRLKVFMNEKLQILDMEYYLKILKG